MSLRSRIPIIAAGIAIIMLSPGISAESYASKCARLEYYDLADLCAGFQTDLQSHVWRSSLFGVPSRIYFQDDGIVLVIPDKSCSVETYTWQISLCDESAYLHVCDAKNDRQYLISPTCSGLAVSGTGKSDALIVEQGAYVAPARDDLLECRVTGTWEYQPSQRQMKSGSAPFSLTLKEDGTYVLHQGPDQYHSPNTGIWKMVPDGMYLILFAQPLGSESLDYIAESLQIQSMDHNTIVVDSQELPRILRTGKRKHKVLSLKRA